jgi:hypothetical protein
MNEAPFESSVVHSRPAGLAALANGGEPLLAGGVTIFTGRFGSGKTETAINYALMLVKASQAPDQGRDGPVIRPRASYARRWSTVFLIDLDIVTPYFRSREVAQVMKAAGISVITPALEGQHLDVPAIAPEILGTIQQRENPVVLDVGGDRQGARALGQFSAAINRHRRERRLRMHFVVNPYRPFTDSLDGLAGSITEIESSSRLHVTSLVSNPNLMAETTLESILEGHAKITRFADALGLPIAFLCVESRLATELVAQDSHKALYGLGCSVLILDRFFAMPWEQTEG